MKFTFESSPVSVITIDNNLWYIAKEVCDILDLGNTSQALSRLDDDEKDIISNDTPGGIQNISIISESGLYSLVLSSRKSSAKAFKKWITSEVIPSIRKTGGYIATTPDMTEADILLRAMNILNSTVARQKEQIKELEVKAIESAPKVAFVNAISTSTNAILVNDLAKILQQSTGVAMGQNRLFNYLRENSYLIDRKFSTQHNHPTQRSLDMGLMRVSETVFHHNDGTPETRVKPLITGKGQEYFVRKFNDLKASGVMAI